ncbi:MAG: hypothetical protein PVF83_18905 [Anaerolineales bacterium]|jgi:hypothetical protein
MKVSKSTALLFLLLIPFFGWKLFSQYDALAASLGLPITPRLSVSDQYLLS